jgi:hypothetical protein
MTNNLRDSEKYIAVTGIDNAMELAKVLLKNGYEVFVELDDCEIYCVHYAYAKYKGFGNAAFYRISEAQADVLDHIDGDTEDDYE